MRVLLITILTLISLTALGQGYIVVSGSAIQSEEYLNQEDGMLVPISVGVVAPIATKENEWPEYFMELRWTHYSGKDSIGERYNAFGPGLFFMTSKIEDIIGTRKLSRLDVALVVGFDWLTYDNHPSVESRFFPHIGIRVKYYFTDYVGVLMDVAYNESSILGMGLFISWNQYKDPYDQD